MKKKIHLAMCSAFLATGLYAQQIPPTPDDALRSAWFIPNGTARSVAIGGAMGSLGGDISAANVNPAGIGVYKSSEFVITPGMILNNNTYDYRGTNSSSNNAAFMYGPVGFVFASGNRKGSWSSSAFSLSVTQLASYNNHQTFTGFNDYSSYSEQFLEELVSYQGRGASESEASNLFPFGSSLAYNTYLVEGTFDNNGNLTGYASRANPATGLMQKYDETTKGGYHEISLGFAGSKNDKWYLGTSINIPVIGYNRQLIYSEDDATADTTNQFGYFDHLLRTKSSGVGINAKLGLIYKASNALRLGFAVHTPSYIGYRDDVYAEMSTETESYRQQKFQTSDEIIANNQDIPTRYYYGQITPYRVIASGSYLFTGAHSSQQKGFISADVEFVNYRGVRYSASNGESDGGYFSYLNDVIKDYYKGNVNVRLGGEMKFDVWMVRLGGAYYGSPYKDKELKASRAQISGGVGYRNKGFFVDLTYAQSFNKDVIFPYRLSGTPDQPVANTFADAKNSRANVLLTFGVKF
ncbi:hypothetical protein QTN47_06025 [Danxiaibacter flavus]|uniref:Aromatic hydrocarbon degradation protein n=1 Tax=Danxiaibacter flavus TaxID=3049108 RepID=A0ABV3ZAZ2_9BACT|nr:hypothetical protein QNM32_06025 [Chitinophagaceae bacterium DXS]